MDNILKNGHLKNAKYLFCWKLLHAAIQFLRDCHLQRNIYLKSLILNSCAFSTFSGLEIKKLVLVGKISWHFDRILHILLILLYFHEMFLYWSEAAVQRCSWNSYFANLWNCTSARVFSCNSLHILRAPFSKNTSERLLLTDWMIKILNEKMLNAMYLY